MQKTPGRYVLIAAGAKSVLEWLAPQDQEDPARADQQDDPTEIKRCGMVNGIIQPAAEQGANDLAEAGSQHIQAIAYASTVRVCHVAYQRFLWGYSCGHAHGSEGPKDDQPWKMGYAWHQEASYPCAYQPRDDQWPSAADTIAQMTQMRRHKTFDAGRREKSQRQETDVLGDVVLQED